MLDAQYHQNALDAYRNYNDSPVQQKLKETAPTLVGVVYWSPGENTAEEIRYELTRMKEAGFTFVRFHGIAPRELDDGSYDCTDSDLRFDIAAEVGLLVYAHAHLEKPSAFALKEAGLTTKDANYYGLEDERVHQAVMQRVAFIVGRYKDHPACGGWAMSGEPPAEDIPLTSDLDKERFLKWLQKQYASPEDIHQAWAMNPRVPEWKRKAKAAPMLVETWEDAIDIASCIKPRPMGTRLAATGMNFKQMYGVNRDLVRYRADRTEWFQAETVRMIKAIDPEAIVGYGNHQLMYANGQLGWDQHASGRVGDMHFSSIHLSWHFEPVHGELDRPHYMQARLTNDVFKGAYTNCYETVGGPVQYSGGYGHHMDADLMRKLMLNFLAAGNEGSAFWSWQSRRGGMEAGEYGMISPAGLLTPWAVEAGAIAKAMARHQHEIWNWDIDPELAIVRSWDTETVMTSEPGRHDLHDTPTTLSQGPAQQHVRGWIGAARAAIDQQVDFQFLTTTEIADGLAGVYPTIYLPHVRCISDETLSQLLTYVEAGGHVIADVQIGFEDQWAKVRCNTPDSILSRLFGAWIDSIHETRLRPLSLDTHPLDGFYGDVHCLDAHVIRRFDNGKAAITEHQVGRGTATLVAFDAGRMCWDPDKSKGIDSILGDLYRAGSHRRYFCDIPTTYRRSHANADHYFIINEGPARSVVLRAYDHQYVAVENVLEGSSRPCSGTIGIDVPAYGGTWIRCTRS